MRLKKFNEEFSEEVYVCTWKYKDTSTHWSDSCRATSYIDALNKFRKVTNLPSGYKIIKIENKTTGRQWSQTSF